MPRKCTVCEHEQKIEINKALLVGEPFRHIAARFGTSTGALQRHKKDHMPVALIKAKNAEEVTEAGSLLDQIVALAKKAENLLNQAENAGDLKTALQGIGQARACLELLARVRGELQESAVNITVSAEWIELRSVILQSLEPYPEARKILSEALERADTKC